MENRDSKSLFDIQKSDLHILEEQEFHNICSIKKLDLDTGIYKHSGFSVSYWIDTNSIPVTLLLEPSGKYKIIIKGTTIKEHVAISRVRKTLDKFTIKLKTTPHGTEVYFERRHK